MEWKDGEITAMIDRIKNAVVKEHTLRVVLASTTRERDTLKVLRKDSKPSLMESGAAKAVWGLRDYMHAAEKEVQSLFIEYTRAASDAAIAEYKAQRKADKSRGNGVEQPSIKATVGKAESVGKPKKRKI